MTKLLFQKRLLHYLKSNKAFLACQNQSHKITQNNLGTVKDYKIFIRFPASSLFLQSNFCTFKPSSKCQVVNQELLNTQNFLVSEKALQKSQISNGKFMITSCEWTSRASTRFSEGQQCGAKKM